MEEWNGLEVVVEKVGREPNRSRVTVETIEEGVEALGVGVEASVFGLQVVCVELEAPHTSEEGRCGRDWARRPWVLASRLRPVGG